MTARKARRPTAAATVALIAATILIAPQAASAHSVSWTVHGVATPSGFAAGDALACEQEEKCDRYQLLVMNAGDAASSSTEAVKVKDTLPTGITTLRTPESESVYNEEGEEEAWHCRPGGVGQTTVTCELERENFEGETFPVSVPARRYALALSIVVSAPMANMAGMLTNEVQVEGGGAPATVSTSEKTVVNGPALNFGLSEFTMEPQGEDGTPALVAGGHPRDLTTSLGVPVSLSPRGVESRPYVPVENLKSVSVELPLGFVGDPRAAQGCAQVELENEMCPQGSQVGLFAIIGGGFETGAFVFSQDSGASECCSEVYSMVPENGYPAEFGFTFLHNPVEMYASVVRSATGYHTRVTVPSIPSVLEVSDSVLTFFGEPGKLNGSESAAAFLTDPVDCAAGPISSRIELESYADPGNPATGETTAYSKLAGCEALQFHPTLSLQPDTAHADSPTGLDVDLNLPQTADFEEGATPPLRDATVSLPAGLSVSPSSADGLAACAAEGPAGINIGSTELGPLGQDLGDPEATELGEGHEGGNESPYDDGYYHTAPGHCPAASKLGTAEVETPLLQTPLKGSVFLGAPDCAPCSGKQAEEGKLLRLYIEAAGSGIIVKLPGAVSASATGQLSAHFAENPQFPFEHLKLHMFGGPRATLTTPPTCGSYETHSDLEPWSHEPSEGEAQGTPDAHPGSPFAISEGPNGSACAKTPAEEPNHPSFEAGTTTPIAGSYSPFVLHLSREDGSQPLKALNLTLPPGLSGRLAGVGECSDAQLKTAEEAGGAAEKANPSCPASSEIGTVNVGAGSGTPYYVQGHAYLAGPYKGAPLSMAIITPALAGPFDLGTVVVRAGLYVNPETAQITVKSDPIPQILDGIPLDLRSIAVNISRNQFTLNPTDCDPLAFSGEAIGASSTAALTERFQVGACNALPFAPHLALSLKGKSARAGNPALKAILTMKPGEANIARAQVTLPHSEFVDNAHIGKVCTAREFAEGNTPGERCSPESIYGYAKAWSPLLEKPVEGPVYLKTPGHKLPDLLAALNGQIDVALEGKVDSGVGGGIRNTFEVVPDAPVTKFELSMKGGAKGLLENSENICGKPQHALAHFTAQNGKVEDLHPLIANSCKSHKRHRRAHRRHR